MISWRKAARHEAPPCREALKLPRRGAKADLFSINAYM